MTARPTLLAWLRSFSNDASALLSTKALVRRLERDLRSQTPSAGVAVLLISLSRSDHLDVLLGKPNGAAAQKELLYRIRSTLRAHDYLAIASSNEIWIVLTGLSSPTTASLAASNLIRVLETPITHSIPIVTVRPVIGIAIAARSGSTAWLMLKAAANAENRARSLKHRYWIAENESADVSSRELVTALQAALAQNRLSVSYQPKVTLSSGQIAGVEALIRWPDDQVLAMTPSMVVDTAEQHGMIQDLTRFVMNTVLREYVGLLAGAGIGKVWVNLSASMLRDPQLPDLLQHIMTVWGVSPQALGFEITESTLLTDVDQSIATLHALVALGFSLAIDDFGTGYSSLVYLRRFPLCELKIDRVFIQHMASSPPDRQIVRAIIDLAHNFQLAVVAEGAEDEPTLALLKEMQCDQVQGYVFTKGLPANELAQWARDHEQSGTHA